MPRFSGDQELELQLPSGRKVSELRFSKSKLSNSSFLSYVKYFVIVLQDGELCSDFRWLTVWCRLFSVNFGYVSMSP